MLLLTFQCGKVRYGVGLSHVVRTFFNAETIPLPGAPSAVTGALRIGGNIVPVIDFCRLTGSEHSVPTVWQRLILVTFPTNPAADPRLQTNPPSEPPQQESVCLLVDEVLGVSERALEQTSVLPDRIERAPYVEGLLQLDDDLCVILAPERIIDPRNAETLRAALVSLTNRELAP